MYDVIAARAEINKRLRVLEGASLEPYLDIGGVPTIGVGATTYPDGRRVTMHDPALTSDQMNKMLDTEVDRGIDQVLPMVDHQCTTMQLVALVLCGYNIGFGGLAGSTIIRLHNKGDFIGASRAFSLWDKVKDPKTGKLVSSHALAVRRLAEAAVYVSDMPVSAMPQTVVSESKLSSSPIMRSAATIAAGGGAVVMNSLSTHPVETVSTGLGQANTIAQQVVDMAHTFGLSLPIVFGVGLIGLAGVIGYWRYQQRQTGRT